MRTLVTGGAGFIGTNLVNLLLREGHDVYVVDNLSSSVAENIQAMRAKVQLQAMDVRDEGLSTVMASFKPEVVFHLAAQIDVRASVADPGNDASTNILGTINVARSALLAGARKVVFASSGGSIYGHPAEFPITEDQPVDPRSPYAAAKVCAEIYLNMFSHLHGLQCTHLALANVYGPGQNSHGEAGVVAIFASALLGRGKTRLFGDGGNTRDYTFVQDVVLAFLAAASADGDRRRYNIGTGRQTSDRDLHNLVAKAVGGHSEPEYAPSRNGDLRRSALDASRAGAELGWFPEVALEQGVELTVEYFRRLGSGTAEAQHKG